MIDKIHYVEDFKDDLFLNEDMCSPRLKLKFDAAGEYPAMFQFMDGYAIQTDDDGVIIPPDGKPLVLYYPTLDEVRGSALMRDEICDYTCRPDINQYDVALKYGLASRIGLQMDESDIRQFLAPHLRGEGIMVFLKKPVELDHASGFKTHIHGVYVDGKDPKEDCVIHDRGDLEDKDVNHNRLTRSYYEFVPIQVRDKVFNGLQEPRRYGQIIPVAVHDDRMHYISVPGKNDIFQDVYSRDHGAESFKYVGGREPRMAYMFKDALSSLHFAADVMEERLHYGDVLEAGPNWRLTVPTANEKILDLAKLLGGYPKFEDEGINGEHFSSLLLVTFEKQDVAQRFSDIVKHLDLHAAQCVRDRILDKSAKAFSPDQRIIVDAYLSEKGGATSEQKTKALDSMWQIVCKCKDVQKVPDKWRADTFNEIAGLIDGHVREAQANGLKR